MIPRKIISYHYALKKMLSYELLNADLTQLLGQLLSGKEN